MLILAFGGAAQDPGKRQALGIIFGCWTMAGFSDCGILASTEGSNNMLVHVRNIVFLMLISWRLLSSKRQAAGTQ